MFAIAGRYAGAAEFYSTSDPTMMYDAPSTKARRLFVLGEEVPLEMIVSVEGWLKVRDAAGSVAWIERRSRHRKTHADRAGRQRRSARRSPDAAAAIVFKADQNVLVELADPVTRPARRAG